ncbi:SMI1/KNR4 family protein [Streptomyces atratus]|uniref:SMI1/KNR4 family protein n=1 Tax=Streptomyces atratus TaxID=1893 RepID=UPI0022529F1C|nr:SMI1/KNR4 family protein [Streptomyces atratus]MCX5342053.1 SMI1/KNR4 family protein [Streptomyces atratus]
MSDESSCWYRGRLVLGPFRPCEADELEGLEREIGLPLPAPYRSFLEAAGGKSLTSSVHLPDCESEPLQSFDDLYQLGRADPGTSVVVQSALVSCPLGKTSIELVRPHVLVLDAFVMRRLSAPTPTTSASWSVNDGAGP